MIIKNNKMVNKIYNGENAIRRLYKGTNKVFEFLPVGYKECKYLESTGTQFINTNIYFDFSQDFKIIGKVINSNIYQRKVILGSYGDSNDNVCCSIEFGGSSNSYPGHLRNYFENTATSTSSIYSDISFPVNCVLTYDTLYCAENKKIINKVEYNNIASTYEGNTISSTSRSTNPLRFFLDYRSYTQPIANPIKIGKTIIYKNNILVADFIPCLDNNNVPCMYDRIRKTTFYNLGTGSFNYELL